MRWTEVLTQKALTTRIEIPAVPTRLYPGEQLLVRDLSCSWPPSACSTERQLGRWQIRPYLLANSESGSGLWVDERLKEDDNPARAVPPEVTITPHLLGWYAIFISVHRPLFHGGIDVRLSSRPFLCINPMEREFRMRDQITPAVEPDGPSDIELEVFYMIAPLDGERLHFRVPDGRPALYPGGRVRSSLTALRFVALTDEQVTEYQADLANSETKQVIINCETANHNLACLDSRVEAWRHSDVGIVHLEFFMAGGGALYPNSQYEQTCAANITPELYAAVKPHQQRVLTDWWVLQARGLTPFDVVSPLARAAGIKVMGSLRMDIYWGDGSHNPQDWRKDSLDEYPLLFNGRYYAEHPELRIPGHHNLDYFYPEVREHFAGLLCEAAEWLDVDGINMDFTRWPGYFIRADADPEIMVDFIRDVRRRLDAIGTAKGRQLLLSADLVDGFYARRSLEEQCVNLEAWLQSGCLDYVAVEAFPHPDFPKPENQMEFYINLGRRTGVPIYPRQDQCFLLEPEKGCRPWSEKIHVAHPGDPFFGDEYLEEARWVPQCGPAHYERGTLHYYEIGAPGVLLANRWEGWLGLRRLGHRDELIERAKSGETFGVRQGSRMSWL